ncbi:site-specific DNA-methyltransferase [Thiospirochaeta perfilievii]|uniref:Site-specific DNA-methyltransferase n=1 Tax=Thiospirochaeta perfilievii TaxID=252967 RepID=A0A5C1Q5H0_9SPIO|nr:site-specific DNA-methyltransferase [Thiospirochaeta perfilievii]QEN03303.1 site-specific DNA-methyltransferase [Thiospirochaeta perfilievii]
MVTTEKYKKKLLNKLTELFQLDQPDLDFGFYRIMHAKAEQISTFIDKDLLQIIEDAFGQVDENRKTEVSDEIHKAIEQAIKYGAPDPELTDGVKEARKKYDAILSSAGAEADVYDHLYRFFERYYDEGDFISRRYYSKENSGKAAPFSIPYNGEEVKLHWANADQYYIKTAEYFSNFTFDITQSADIKKMSELERSSLSIPESLKVHFRIVDAAEGEHGNVKATEDKKRFFVLYDGSPVEFNEKQELVINFEYKTLPGGKNDVDAKTEKELKEIYGKGINKGDLPNLNIGKIVLDTLENLEGSKQYKDLLSLKAPTDKSPNRPILVKYINQYTARNTCDYFIHKDLSGFLKRELDFYIKNEVMNLDDIENAEAPTVESYLAKIKVIRKISTKLIEFLAQLEDFQKKLWLKKKFVTETNYCITLDRVPKELYQEIADNNEQREEWIKLFAIDDIQGTNGDLLTNTTPSYTNPLTIDFLKTNDKLVLDTAFFSEDFKAKLIESINDFDEQCDGLLIHSENFQALNLLQDRYREQVKCVYIDPPYNTGKDGFIYKDGYRSSTWSSLMNSSLSKVKTILSTDSLLFISNDDNENDHLKNLLFQNTFYFKTNLIWNTDGRTDNQFEVKVNHEYITLAQKTPKSTYGNVIDPNTRKESNLWKNIAENSITKNGVANPYSEVTLPIGFPVKGNEGIINKDVPSVGYFDELGSLSYYPRNLNKKYNVNFPIKFNDAYFSGGKLLAPLKVSAGWANLNKLQKFIENDCVSYYDEDGVIAFYLSEKGTVYYIKEKEASRNIVSVLRNFTTTEKMKYELEHMKIYFSYPKPKDLIGYLLKIGDSSLYLDYFAGSGTTGHAVINLNREDGGNRKFILVEMGDYFDTVTKPRIVKVIYSTDWKDGKPVSRDSGISQCFKYLRLESYEDTLNNLSFDEDTNRNRLMEKNNSLREDYMLRYMLDVETRGSQSLLNIDNFSNPFGYSLKVKKPGSDEQVTKNIDIIETFNYLIGLRLENMARTQSFSASFIRNPDPELPEDQHTKLVLDGKITLSETGKWLFRKIEGWVPANSNSPNNGLKEKVLIVWRNLTGNLEEDNLMLDEWFKKYRLSTTDFEFDTIYINGSNNLPNLKQDDENWKVRLIEEEFHKKMWDTGDNS